MGYVANSYVDPDSLEGFWSTVGGVARKAGQFAVKATTGVSIGNGNGGVPDTRTVVLSDRGGTVSTPEPSFLDRLRARAMERLQRDPEFRRTAVDATARLPPSLIAATAARQARAAAPVLGPALLIPAALLGITLLRRRR